MKFKIEKLEERVSPSVATTTFSVKIPGPTDAVITTAENPGGNNPPGHQDAILVKNKLAR